MLLRFVLKRPLQQFSFANPCAKLPYRSEQSPWRCITRYPTSDACPNLAAIQDCLRSINNEKID